MKGPKTNKTVCVLNSIKTNKVKKKRTLFNKTRQYNIHIFHKIIFLNFVCFDHAILKKAVSSVLMVRFSRCTADFKDVRILNYKYFKADEVGDLFQIV